MSRRFYKAFGKRLERARKQENLSQLDMAIFLHTNVKEVRRYEAGFKPLSISNFFKVCEFLDLNPGTEIIAALKDWVARN